MKKPTEKQIRDKCDEAGEAAHKQPKFSSMTYAEGVRDALEWVLGETEDDLEL